MKFCSSCGAELNEDSKFCGSCGAAVQGNSVNDEPMQGENAEEAQVNDAYTYVMPPEKPKPSIAKAIISIALGGEALVMALYCLLYTLMYYADGTPEVGIVYNLLMTIFIIPSAIVSMVLGGSYLKSNADRLRGLPKVGKILSICSIALFAFSFVLSFVLIVA